MLRVNKVHDLLVIGGGIVGCATAREIAHRHPDFKIAILEKEDSLGRNSGVIHAGVYYAPGTLKAKLCVEGSRRLYQYCDERGIPAQRVGKLILAADENEVPRLRQLLQRGTSNQVPGLQLVDKHEAQEIQAGVSCAEALWSPSTGITDYSLIAKSFASESNADVVTHFQVAQLAFDKSRKVITVKSTAGHQVDGRFVITAGGLFADKLSVLSGCKRMPAIVPFRGEYLLMKPSSAVSIRTNLYPVPDPRFPFLGVHFTPRLDGSVLIGPNAVFAFRREGYARSDFSWSETWESLTHAGFQSMASKYFVKGLDEMRRSVFMGAQLQLVKRMVPEISAKDVTRGPSGVRAQALDEDGNLVDDFLFETGTGELRTRILNVRNAPSPAATSSLCIASLVADKFEQLALSHSE